MFNEGGDFNDFLPPWMKCAGGDGPINSSRKSGPPQMSRPLNNNVSRCPSTSADARDTFANRILKMEDYSPKFTMLNPNHPISRGRHQKSLTILQKHHQQQQENADNRNGLFMANATEEDEIRLLREMGWDEFQDEVPLTHEEIITFQKLTSNRHQHVFDELDNRKPDSETIHDGSHFRNLKQALLATMGVPLEDPNSDDEDSEQDSE